MAPEDITANDIKKAPKMLKYPGICCKIDKGCCIKGHFTKVYSIKVCELQNFPKFPWDPVIGLDSIQTVCLQLNPIGGSQGNFEVHSP